MALTIRVNQKHVERFAFLVIIAVLAGLLIQEKYVSGEVIEDSDLTGATGYSVRDLIPVDTETTTTTTAPSSTTSTTTTSTTTTTTSTTTTTLPRELSFTIRNIAHEKIDDDKGKIKSFYIDVTNGLSDNLDLTLEYYIYDDESLPSERITPKKPVLNVGFLEAGGKLSKKFEIDKYVFNLDLEKTMKFQLSDEVQDIEKTQVQKVTVD